MRFPFPSLAFALSALFAVNAHGQELTVHGNFKRMLHTGESAGVVALDTLQAPSSWGVGATAGLKGEIVIIDGKVRVSRGSDPQARIGAPRQGEQATILAHGAAQEWRSITLPNAMDVEQFTHFVALQAELNKLDLHKGFALRVKGTFPQLVWHVVTGEAPKHNAASGGHANNRSGFNLFEENGASGEIVGVYAGREQEGKASHPGEMLHMHFVNADGTRSGHVDAITFRAGAVLLLPTALQ